MKYKTTRKNMLAWYDCFQVYYCDLQNLLRFENARTYTCGVYGWNADCYIFGDISLVTGYRPFGRRIKNYDLVRQYDRYARTILDNYSYTFEERHDLIDILLEEFIEQIA